MGTGLESGNDDGAITLTKSELQKRIDIVKSATNDNQIFDIWGKFSSGQSAEKIQNDVLSNDGIVTAISYRPFDIRWTFYSGKSCGWIFRPRNKNIIGQVINSETSPIGNNIGLVFAKQTTSRFEWDGIFISDKVIVKHYVDYPAKSTGYFAPLYLRPEGLETKWQPNFNAEKFEHLTKFLTEKPTPIEVLDYIYGILFDPVYRIRFSEYLRRDFPRVPVINAPKESDDDFVVTEEMFHFYVIAGERLRKLHLMQTKTPAPIEIAPPTATDLEIGAIKYKDGVLQLNPSKQITGIPEEVWNYRIGGYQVLDKWFKSHKRMTMTIDDFDHIANVVGLLAETIKIQDDLRELTAKLNKQQH
ncbi:MAG: hypothetical protein FWC91_05050 [Defluviitaleaceae bacterium]|nr:hypothetical protein [Defluviitaleaceae bacterium]